MSNDAPVPSFADAGFGIKAAAAQYELDFIPLLTERYYLACRADALKEPELAEFIALLRGEVDRLIVSRPAVQIIAVTAERISSRAARIGKTILVNKYYLDYLYENIIVAGISGPISRAMYWVNQNVIDGLVNLVGTSARDAGGWVYRRIDQGVVDTVVNGSGTAAEGSGEILRKAQTGKVQAYGAYLFLGAIVLAAILVIAS